MVKKLSIRETDRIVKKTPRAGQGARTIDGESIRDTNPIVSGAKDVKKQFTENPKRNEQDMELCLSCQTLHLKGTACPTCKLTEKQVKETAWEKFHSTGKM